MKNKIVIGISALVIVLIIITAIILCLDIFNKEKNENKEIDKAQEQEEVEQNIYDEKDSNNASIDLSNIFANNNNVVDNKLDTIENESKQIEMITSDELKAEYNKKINSMNLDMLLLRKGKYESIAGTEIVEFNSGKFSEQEKMSLVYLAIDFTKEEHIDGPQYLVSMESIQQASLKLFEEKIDISKLQNVTIVDGKIKLVVPTGRAAHIFKAKSLVYDKNSEVYTLIFDYLEYSIENAQYSIINYSKDAIYGTFELKYKENENNVIYLEMNKI